MDSCAPLPCWGEECAVSSERPGTGSRDVSLLLFRRKEDVFTANFLSAARTRKQRYPRRGEGEESERHGAFSAQLSHPNPPIRSLQPRLTTLRKIHHRVL
jgi:hypothetical protein